MCIKCRSTDEFTGHLSSGSQNDLFKKALIFNTTRIQQIFMENDYNWQRGRAFLGEEFNSMWWGLILI